MPSIGKQLDLEGVQDILGRALIDFKFREELLTDPATTLQILGYSQSDDSLRFFQALNNNVFKQAAQETEDRVGGRPVIAVWL
ncbi:MAG: hypothetical protein GPJ07_15725 [Microcystis aeruginosa G13-07]|jgi:hypothetical protein|nr:hypothetical protein [Microcystis aeruginosa G13-07]